MDPIARLEAEVRALRAELDGMRHEIRTRRIVVDNDTPARTIIEPGSVDVLDDTHACSVLIRARSDYAEVSLAAGDDPALEEAGYRIQNVGMTATFDWPGDTFVFANQWSST